MKWHLEWEERLLHATHKLFRVHEVADEVSKAPASINLHRYVKNVNNSFISDLQGTCFITYKWT